MRVPIDRLSHVPIVAYKVPSGEPIRICARTRNSKVATVRVSSKGFSLTIVPHSVGRTRLIVEGEEKYTYVEVTE